MKYKAICNRERESPHILIVGRDKKTLDFLNAALEECYTVENADACTPAFERLREGNAPFSLVMLCSPLFDMNLEDALKRMVADPLLNHIPVILLSEDGKEGIHALNSSAMDYIHMPCSLPEIVLTRVRHAIELSENKNTLRSIERDPLTGLYNKDFFFSYARRFDLYHKETEMDAVVVNISHFHLINERYGCHYGDDLLRCVGRRIEAYIGGDGALVCRRDADIFLIYCPHREDYEALLRDGIPNMGGRIRLRVGVYPCVDKTMDIERRFDRAKQAADTLRNSFNKNVALYDDELRRTELYYEQLLEDFPRAIANKEFVVYYQPKFAIQGTLPVLNSAEALVRWRHPTLGLISPGDFIPLFENNGMISQLDAFVWEEVARQMRKWKDGLGMCVPVSVNISRVDFFDSDLADHLRRLIQTYGLSPEEFLLEITESAYTQDSDRIIHTVKALRDEGFRIEIDDFGSGYSSLNMIASLPMDALKIDMEFIRNAFKERKNTRMLYAVIDIAYSLDVPTVAEGVETAEQLFALKEMGCDVVQGYYFSKPLPVGDFERYLNNRETVWTYTADKDPKIKPTEQFAYALIEKTRRNTSA